MLEKLSMTHTSTWLHETDDPIPGTEHGEVGSELARADWVTATRRST